jgi:hypothetical protein
MTTQNGDPANHLFAYAVEEYDAGNGKKAKPFSAVEKCMDGVFQRPARAG